MHIPNQHGQSIYYFPQYQHNNTMPIQFQQSHSAHQIIYRNEPINHHQRVINQGQFIQNKMGFNVKDNQKLAFRKDISKPCSVYATQAQTSKVSHFQMQNAENANFNLNKLSSALGLENSQRNKSLLAIKRKESINSNSKQVREEYYKGQQQIQQLINRLPQIDIQPLNKGGNRPFQTSPNVQLKIKQIKKVVSPFNFHSRSVSFKQSNNSEYVKKLQANCNDQNSNIRESLKFNSPPKSFNSPNKYFKELQRFNQNPQRNSDSRCSTRKQSIADTSNSTSMLLESCQFKFNSSVPSLQFPNQLIQTKKQAECQVNLDDQINMNKMKELKQKLAIIQKDLQQQKIINHQKQVKLKNMQHQLNTVKINYQKKMLIFEKEFNSKKQLQIIAVRQQFQKQLARFMADIKQKSNIQIKQISCKLQNQLQNTKNLCLHELKKMQQEKKQISLLLKQKQYEINKLTISLKQLNQQKLTLNKKLQIFTQQNKKQSEQIQKLLIQKQKQINTKTFQSKQKNTDTISNQQNLKLINSLNSQIQTLQKKLISSQNNLQKQTIKYKQIKQQLQKLNILLIQKQMKNKNMLKDLRNRDRFITDMTKNCNQLDNLTKTLNNQIIKLQLKIKNDKYCTILQQNLDFNQNNQIKQ